MVTYLKVGMENLYEILEVSPDASQEDLRKSYVRLAKVHHPDKTETTIDLNDQSSNSNGRTSKFVKINHAWSILSDIHLRKQYDIKWKERCMSQYLPIQENVVFQDFEFEEADQVYIYPCRCGSDYILSKTDAKLHYDIVCCETCSLTVQVEYDSNG